VRTFLFYLVINTIIIFPKVSLGSTTANAKLDVLLDSQSIMANAHLFNRVNEFINENSGSDLLKTNKGKLLLINHEKMGNLLSIRKMFDNCDLNSKRENELKDQVMNSIGTSKRCVLKNEGYFSQFKNLEDFSDSIIDMAARVLPTGSEFQKQMEVKSGLFENISRRSQKNAIISLVSHLKRFDSEFSKMGQESQEKYIYDFLCHNNIVRSLDTCRGTYLNISKEIRSAIKSASKVKYKSPSKVREEINLNYINLNHKLDNVSRKLGADEGYIYMPGLWDSSDPVIPDAAKKAYSEYKKEYSKFSSTPVGSLLFSDQIESSGGRFRRLKDEDMNEEKKEWFGYTTFEMKKHEFIDTEDTKKAITEIKERIGKQFRLLNYLEKNSRVRQRAYLEHIRERDPRWEARTNPVSMLDTSHQTFLNNQIDKLVVTNPAAVAQFLLEKPGNVPLICESISRAAKNEKLEEEWNDTWAHGGLIVGGVLMATGVFAPEGALVASLAAGTGLIVSVADAYYFGGRALSKHQEYEDYKRGFFGGSSDPVVMEGAQQVAEDYESALVDFGLSFGFSLIDLASLSRAKNLVKGADEVARGKTVLEKSKNLWRELSHEPDVISAVKKLTQTLGDSGKAKVTEYFNLLSTLPERAKNNIIDQLKSGKTSIKKFKQHVEEFLDIFNRSCK